MSNNGDSIAQLPSGGLLRPGDMLAVSRANSGIITPTGIEATTLKVLNTLNAPVLKAANTLARGDAVYINSEGKYALARADTLETCRVVGFAYADYAIDENVYLDTEVAYVDSTLTLGTPYYLSNTVIGGIVSTPPTGAYLVQVGVGASNETGHILRVQIGNWPLVKYHGAIPQYMRKDFVNSTLVEIEHGFGQYPTVSIIGSAGTYVMSNATNVSLDVVRVIFNTPFTGSVILTT